MSAADSLPRHFYLLPLGTATVQLPDGRSLDLVAASYLVALADGRHILIDTGLPADVPLPGGTQVENACPVLAHLAALGLGPEDIDVLICTHFDVDHVGQHDVFTRAELVVQRRHYAVARGGHARYAAVRVHWDAPALHYRLVEGDTELVPGVRLLETSGHAPGHQSVLVRLPATGAVLLTIDAVPLERLFTPERAATAGDDDAEELRASTRKLLDVVEREQVALVVFGHDGAQRRTLKTAPDSYD